ncbi:hypothetical protein KY284_013753 [Solanum tuberosum]|nr:hypothetical protein KY284_013753 [Solanum tuberosum]
MAQVKSSNLPIFDIKKTKPSNPSNLSSLAALASSSEPPVALPPPPSSRRPPLLISSLLPSRLFSPARQIGISLVSPININSRRGEQHLRPTPTSIHCPSPLIEELFMLGN